MPVDFSTFLLGPGRLEHEESEWERHKFYVRNAAIVKEFMAEHNLHSVLEIGCGAGGVATFFDDFLYLGVDANPNCLELCRKKNPNKNFILSDIRDLPYTEEVDVVCSFAFMKHFGLHEWDAVLGNLLRRAKFSVIAIAIADKDMDDGVEWHHASVTIEHLVAAVRDAGHEVIKTEWQADSATGYETLCFTRRV